MAIQLIFYIVMTWLELFIFGSGVMIA